MNLHASFSANLPVRAWFGFVPLTWAAFLICLLVGASPLKGQPVWTVTGSLGTPRYGHSAILLANGKVLVGGGVGSAGAELYDPATGEWSATGGPTLSGITLRLADGKVLVLRTGANGSAELYDPDIDSLSAAGNLVVPSGATVTLLTDGRLLVAGGSGSAFASPLRNADLYDPATGVLSPTGRMNLGRSSHTATLLSDGKVLVVSDYYGSAFGTSELYDPVTGNWTLTGKLTTPRYYHTATLLANGKVLVAGGGLPFEDCKAADSAELYDPATGQWSATGKLTARRANHTATLLLSGKVLVTGGYSDCLQPNSVDLPDAADLYDPATGNWNATARLNTPRFGETATLLANGRVLIAGGSDGTFPIKSFTSAELFDSGAANVASVSAASLAAGGTLAPESIAVILGTNLATDIQTATSLPLPAELVGVSVKVRDSAGAERPAPLFFVSPGKIKYQVPPATINGLATVTITRGPSVVASGLVEIAQVAPGLFSANSDGQGVASAFAWRIRTNGAQQFEPIARFDPAQNRYVAEPIDLGPETDQVFLILYGTGIRFHSGLSGVSSSIGGESSEVTFAGAAPGFVGLDQINMRLPRSLAGRGEVSVSLSVDGKPANTVGVNIR